MDFYKICHSFIKLFPKQERYSLGQKIENTTLEILESILQAVYMPKYKKIEVVRRASDKTDLLKYLLRLAHDTKSINLKGYITLGEMITEIGKMFGGWIRSIS